MWGLGLLKVLFTPSPAAGGCWEQGLFRKLPSSSIPMGEGSHQPLSLQPASISIPHVSWKLPPLLVP